MAAKYVDVLQIPAFLCRQTDLLAAAARTGKAVNIKKGQFMSGVSMKFAVEKVLHENPAAQVFLTDRGNSFGYGDLVVDYRNLPEMQAHGVPVVMDCTHSLQRPNQSTGVTGGATQNDRNYCQSCYCSWGRWYFYRNSSKPINCQVGRSKYVTFRPIRRAFREISAS